MTAQRKRRGRKPGTILKWLKLFASEARCSCGSATCASTRSRLLALIRELRAALKGAKKT